VLVTRRLYRVGRRADTVAAWTQARIPPAAGLPPAGVIASSLSTPGYAKVLDGEEDRMNELIEKGFAEHDEQP
jgi:hypothetical protein